MSTVPVPLPPAESQLSCLETAQSLGEGANLTSSIVGDGDSDRLPLSTPLRVAPYQPGLLFLEAGRAGSVVGEESERTPGSEAGSGGTCPVFAVSTAQQSLAHNSRPLLLWSEDR